MYRTQVRTEQRTLKKFILETRFRLLILPTLAATSMLLPACKSFEYADGCEPMKKNCDACLNRMIDDGLAECIGAAVVSKDRLVYTYHKTNGKRPEYAKVGPDSTFAVASVSKIYMATCLMMLAEDGSIALSDKVQRYIPEYPHPDVQIIHLMTHTSGDNGKSTALSNIADFYKQDAPLDWNPGEKCRYFNQGYIILTDLLQRVTGQALEDFAQERIFRPLGMSRTSFLGKYVSDSDVAGVQNGENFVYKVPGPSNHVGSGDAGLRSTPEDMVKFGAELLRIYKTGKRGILSPLTVTAMFRRCPPPEANRSPVFYMKTDDGEDHGFNRFFLGAFTSSSACGHTGASGCMLVIDPENDFTYAVLTNSPTLHGDCPSYQRMSNVFSANLP